jgi:CO/xanthine dehydrogenase FAD-binding subunit
MKPVAFAYAAPRTLDEALALFAEHGDEAKALAGGQSLVPMLNFRLVRPAMLVDLNRVAGCAGLGAAAGGLHVGALVRTAMLARDPAVAAGWPLLRDAARLVGHPAIRNRGTVGGSAAHADPQAELPAALVALDARFHLRSQRTQRVLGADVFFTDFFATALAPDELLVAIEVPASPPRTGTAFVEETRTHGDFALAGAAVTVTLDAAGRCAQAAIAILGGGATPVRAHAGERSLIGTVVDDAAARAAGALAAAACDPPEPADYRRALVAELARRALVTARERAA